MNAQRLIDPPAAPASPRRPPPAASGSVVEPLAAAVPPPACEYADIGIGNGFLLDRAGERPALNVIGEIG